MAGGRTSRAGTAATQSAKPLSLRPVKRPQQQVEEQIRTAILSGELAAGDRLPSEMELASQFSVSRTTVREALRALVAQGLVAKARGPRGGSFVQRIDGESVVQVLSQSVHNLLAVGRVDFEEVSLLRQHLEVPSARLAAQNRTEDDVSALHRIVAAEKQTTVEDPAVPSLDVEFHTTIARASGNRLLTTFVAALHHNTEPVRYVELSPEVGRLTVKQHSAIVAAISAQRPDDAGSAMVEHLTYLRQMFQRQNEG